MFSLGLIAGTLRTSFMSGQQFNATWHLAYPHKVSFVNNNNNIHPSILWWHSSLMSDYEVEAPDGFVYGQDNFSKIFLKKYTPTGFLVNR